MNDASGLDNTLLRLRRNGIWRGVASVAYTPDFLTGGMAMDADRQRDFTPTLREVRRRRADLHRALIDVEEAISGPAGGRLDSWTADVTKQLHSLLTTIDEHVEVTERVGGLYDEIQQRAPHLSNHVRRLHDEHPTMRTETLELVNRFENDPIGGDWSIDDARDDVQRLLGRIVRHRQHGADLVWEAYNLDIGGHE